MKNRHALAALSLMSLSGLLLVGCASGGPQAAEADQLKIVATTNVYGDIAQQIAGDHASVTEIITSPAQDPHSYESTARDKLTLSEADIVLANGGGYDTFMDQLFESLPQDQSSKITLMHAVDSSPVAEESETEGSHADESHAEESHADESHAEESHADEHGHAAFNEHIWYDLDSMGALADALAAELGSKDSANAATYTQNAQTFNAGLDKLRTELNDAGLKGKSYLMTEPLPQHLLDDAGMVNKTPEGLSEAIEEGQGVAPLTLKKAEETLNDKSVDMMVYNPQTEGSETQKLRSIAEGASVPVVDLTETITDGAGYLQWMGANIQELSSAAKGK